MISELVNYVFYLKNSGEIIPKKNVFVKSFFSLILELIPLTLYLAYQIIKND
jgi:hypothetical protein